MTEFPSDSTRSVPAAYRRGASVRGVLRSVVVVTFVVWHLMVLTLRNTVEMFSLATTHRRPAYEALDRAMRYYESRLAMYQTWPMFTSPLSRSGPFLTTRLDFADGSSFDIRSDNEPADLNSFFRIGLARQRKHEDYLANTRPEERWHYERPLWEQFVRWKIDRWRHARPDDERRIVAATLIVERVCFPEPNEPTDVHSRERIEIARFGPDGMMR